MSEYEVVPFAYLLSYTFPFVSSLLIHQSGCVNTRSKPYTSYHIYDTKATNLHQRVNKSAENISFWLTRSLKNLWNKVAQNRISCYLVVEIQDLQLAQVED